MRYTTMRYVRYLFLLALGTFLWQPIPSYAEKILPHITILHEGYVQAIEERNFVPGERDDGARKVATTVALVEAENAVILIDPGMLPASVDLAAQIESMGFTPEDITHIFISHHHPDHTVKIGMFQNATVVDFWGSYTHDLWEDHGDDYEMAKNVIVMRTPGHTHEDASLLVKAKDGAYVFTHVWWNENMQPEIDPLAEEHKKLVESRGKVLAIADYIIPGHGKMFANPDKKN